MKLMVRVTGKVARGFREERVAAEVIEGASANEGGKEHSLKFKHFSALSLHWASIPSQFSLSQNLILKKMPNLNRNLSLPLPIESVESSSIFVLEDLPDDLVRVILRSRGLCLRDIMAVACTSRRLCRLAREASIEGGRWSRVSVLPLPRPPLHV
jgi:hypothetical protein